MCGIFGINTSEEKFVESALTSFEYRGPDDTGIFSDGAVTLGHNRLAIIDCDKRSNQPMSNPQRDIIIVFNGEIYNYQNVRKQLAQDFVFNTNSDTEVLIYAYQRWGSKLVEYIRGMYAFGIYDKKEKKIVLIRDPLGIKPLYYYMKDGLFIFASEIKGIISILKSKGIQIEINKDILDIYFTLGYIPCPQTLYLNIYKLNPGSLLEYGLEERKILNYNHFCPQCKESNNIDEYCELIERKILDHLVSDVPVGVFFSGGTDSSLIVAVLQKHLVHLESFSVIMGHKNEDRDFIGKISKWLTLKNHSYSFSNVEFDQIYFDIMSKIDEPSYDSSIFPTYYLCKKAAPMVKVILSGEGGDEFFYGYPRHLTLAKLQKDADYHISIVDKLFCYLPQFPYKQNIFEKMFKLNRQPFSYYLSQVGVSYNLAGWTKCKKLFKEMELKPMDIDKRLYLENDLLRKIDFATSYASIEGRVPLLDLDIVKNAEKYEKSHLEKDILKSLLKSILCRFIPEEFVYRGKSGFGINMRHMILNSMYLKNDLTLALDHLGKLGLLDIKNSQFAYRNLLRNPPLCYALVCLYYCIKNQESIVPA